MHSFRSVSRATSEKLTTLREEMGKLAVYEMWMLASPDAANLHDRSRQPLHGIRRYWTTACQYCSLKPHDGARAADSAKGA